MDFGGAFEKTFAIPGGRGARGEQQKSINRNEDDEKAVPFGREQIILQRDDDEKGDEQGAMITPFGGGEGDEFAQGPKGDQSKKDIGGGLAGGHGGEKNYGHDPPGANARVEIFDGGQGLF